MEDSVTWSQIVQILNEDPVLAKNILEFADALNVSAVNSNLWIMQRQMGVISNYELLSKLIIDWMSRSENNTNVKNLSEILNNHFWRGSAEALTLKLPPMATIASSPTTEFHNGYSKLKTTDLNLLPKIKFGVRKGVEHFVGRQAELAQLHYIFETKSHRRILISALGGIGKTELTKMFLQNISRVMKSFIISWFAGENEDTLRSSAKDFCTHLGLPTTVNVNGTTQPMTTIQLAACLSRHFQTQAETRWLIVLDNVDDVHEGFIQIAEELYDFENSFLIVTSRNQDITVGEFFRLTIFELNSNESISLVRKHLEDFDSIEHAEVIEEMCELLQYYPLALAQACAYIKQQKAISLKGTAYCVKDYIKDLKQNQSTGLNHGLQISNAGYKKPTMNVWEVTLRQIKSKKFEDQGQTAYNLLKLIVYMNPDCIEMVCLYDVVKSQKTLVDKTKCEINSAAQLLKKYSIVMIENDTISIHRLAQFAVREILESDDTTADKIVLSSLWEYYPHLCASPRAHQETSESKHQERLMIHILSFWKHFFYNPELLIKNKELAITPLERLKQLGMDYEGKNFSQSILPLFVSTFGVDQIPVLKVESYVIKFTKNLMQYEQAIHGFENLLVKLVTILGKTHELTCKVAKGFSKLNQYTINRSYTREEMYARISTPLSRLFGPQCKWCLLAKYGYGFGLAIDDRFTESFSVFETLLKEMVLELGKDDKLTGLTASELSGMVKYPIDGLSKDDVYSRIYSIFIITYGSTHKVTWDLTIQYTKALALDGKYNEAIHILVQMLEEFLDVFDEASKLVVENVLYALISFVRNDKILGCSRHEVYVKVETALLKTLGKRANCQLWVTKAKREYADALRKDGKFPEARKEYEDVWEWYEMNNKTRKHCAMWVKYNIGNCYFKEGNRFEAIINLEYILLSCTGGDKAENWEEILKSAAQRLLNEVNCDGLE